MADVYFITLAMVNDPEDGKHSLLKWKAFNIPLSLFTKTKYI
jgi:hypothetical protein